MARNVNLNSIEWCDMVFEGKNKDYGAYEMRQTSTKRHIIALVCVALFTATVALIPQFMKAVSVEKDIRGGIDEQVVLANIMDKPEKPEEEVIAQTMTAPPPKMVAAVQFTPPVITEAENVTAENEMRSQEELRDARGIISTVNFDSDITTGGEDPGEVLKEHRNITGEGDGGSGAVDFAEVMPQFPGGKTELGRFLSNNLRYPTIAAENGIQGRVIVKFIVTKDGSIKNAEVVRSLDPSCDKEALRVVNSMPKWIPGMQNGNKVAVYFNLPILFRLQ